MKTERIWISAILVFAACSFAPNASGVVINFDDRPGLMPPFSQGQPIPAANFVHSEYLPLGVVSNSDGGGIAIVAATNAVSHPNSADATEAGPVNSYRAPVSAEFFQAGTFAVTDSVSLTLTDSSSSSTLTAYDFGGVPLGAMSGGASAVLTVSSTGRIHSVVLSGGPFSFDNFTYNGLAVAPEPSAFGLMLAATCALLVFQIGRSKAVARLRLQ